MPETPGEAERHDELVIGKALMARAYAAMKEQKDDFLAACGAKHTPGPWYCNSYDTRHDFPARQYVVFGGGHLLVEVAGNGSGASGANARLIAASPELLSACKEVYSILLNGVPRDLEALSSALAHARAAITKAEFGA